MQFPTIFLNKKSTIAARKVIHYMVATILISIGFLILVWIIPHNQSEISIIPSALENYLLTQRFFSASSCFTYQDEETNRVYPLTIDLTKFNEDGLNKCYDAENRDVKGYKLTLEYDNEKITINTKNWEGFIKKREKSQIFVYDSGVIQKAELFIEVQDVKHEVPA